jgi:hypothetical protein
LVGISRPSLVIVDPRTLQILAGAPGGQNDGRAGDRVS